MSGGCLVNFSGLHCSKKMSTLAVLRKGQELMVTGSQDPVALAIALGAQLGVEVRLVATFPGKTVGEEWGKPVGQWFNGSGQEVLHSLVSVWSCESPRGGADTSPDEPEDARTNASTLHQSQS